MNAGVGWTFHVNDFMIAAAGVGNALHLTFDYDASKTFFDTSFQMSHGVTSQPITINNQSRYFHKHNVTMLRFAIPLGMEYELVKNLHVRAGWVAEFLHSMNKDNSLESGYRTTNNQINLSTVNFGLGYQIFDRLRADFVNFGDIAQPRNWNVSAMYSFAE